MRTIAGFTVSLARNFFSFSLVFGGNNVVTQAFKLAGDISPEVFAFINAEQLFIVGHYIVTSENPKLS